MFTSKSSRAWPFVIKYMTFSSSAVIQTTNSFSTKLLTTRINLSNHVVLEKDIAVEFFFKCHIECLNQSGWGCHLFLIQLTTGYFCCSCWCCCFLKLLKTIHNKEGHKVSVGGGHTVVSPCPHRFLQWDRLGFWVRVRGSSGVRLISYSKLSIGVTVSV